MYKEITDDLYPTYEDYQLEIEKNNKKNKSEELDFMIDIIVDEMRMENKKNGSIYKPTDEWKNR